MKPPTSVPLRFGIFEVDPSTGQLRKQGLRLKLHDKAFELLLALIERPGEVVSRDALCQRLWSDDVFVEFDNNLNNTMSRLREALNDSAEAPRFIETIPRRGYRFIAPVEVAAAPAPALATVPGDALGGTSTRARKPVWLRIAFVAVLAVSASGVVGLSRYAPWNDTRPPLDSLAVLPFVAGHSQDDYLAFGVTEALVTELSRIPALKVISQTSASQYKGASKAVSQIARELGVAGVVEGSVVREGESLRITVQLIDAANDAHVWADTYIRDARNLLQMQSEVARAVAREVRVQVTPDTPSRPPAAVNPQVHEAYLRGRFSLGLGTESGRASALTHFGQALAIDPDHAPSYAGLANYYTVTDSLPASVAMPKARTYARKALELDGTLPDAHASLAFIHYYADWDWQAAEAQFERALEGDPGNSRTRRWYAMYLSTMGRHSEALEQVQRALDVDPLSVMAHDSAALVWIHARRADRALDAGRNILTLSPDSPVGFEHLAIASVLSKDHSRAMDMIHRGLAASDRDGVFLTLLAHLQGVLGQRAEMRETLDELTAKARTSFVSPTFFAIAWLGLAEREAAIEWLEKGFEVHDPYLVLLKVSPWFDQLRGVPRFQVLLDRMSFPG
jgi:TolB-like protein/DNA-binding winged helix-turn-helix (wHTH) protein/tetratricopeptide (TPR) repeat protein